LTGLESSPIGASGASMLGVSSALSEQTHIPGALGMPAGESSQTAIAAGPAPALSTSVPGATAAAASPYASTDEAGLASMGELASALASAAPSPARTPALSPQSTLAPTLAGGAPASGAGGASLPSSPPDLPAQPNSPDLPAAALALTSPLTSSSSWGGLTTGTTTSIDGPPALGPSSTALSEASQILPGGPTGKGDPSGSTSPTSFAPHPGIATSDAASATAGLVRAIGSSPARAGSSEAIASSAQHASSLVATASVEETGLGTQLAAAASAPGIAASPNAEASPLSALGVPMQEMIDSIRATIEIATRQGVARARIELQPEELGHISIRISQTSEGLRARVSADTVAGGQALAQGRSELRQALTSLGLSLVQLDIGSSGQSQAHDAHEGFAGRSNDGSGPAGARAAGEEDEASGDPSGGGRPAGPALGEIVDVLA
jgi:flagellar hook-length control protein FliK